MTPVRAVAGLGLLISIVLGSTVFYRFVEGWTWVDSYFFTIVTLSTVGYGNLVPETNIGKIGTTVLIFVGIGVFALAIQQFASFAVRSRERHNEELFRRLHSSSKNKDHDPDA